MSNEFVAIDILALIFPTAVYLKLVEKLHPHEPATTHIGTVVKQLTPEQKAFVQARLRTFNAYTEAVEKALNQTGKQAAA
jgi:hypothetical protein